MALESCFRLRMTGQSAMWVETFAALWGLLDQATQERLAKLYEYDPETFTRRSIFWSVVGGGLLVLRGGWLMVSGVAGSGDAVGVFFGMFLVWEAWMRWSKLGDGEVPGSLLGVALRRLARRFLRWE